MAKVIEAFKGVPDGQTQPRTFAVGDDVTGDLARVALDEGWATEDEDTGLDETPDEVEIPDDWRDLHHNVQRKLAGALTGEEVKTKAEAVAIIEKALAAADEEEDA